MTQERDVDGNAETSANSGVSSPRVLTPNVLVLYATRHGQTRKVAERIAERVRQAGAAVHLVDARDRKAVEAVDLEDYDRLVFGASMHAGGLERELVGFVNRHASEIDLKPRWFFLVLLSAATSDREIKARWLADARRKVESRLEVPFGHVEMIAGALPYSKYALPIKWMMRRIAKQAGGDTDVSKDYEYTDWSQVDRYADQILEHELRPLAP